MRVIGHYQTSFIEIINPFINNENFLGKISVITYKKNIFLIFSILISGILIFKMISTEPYFLEFFCVFLSSLYLDITKFKWVF